MMLSDWSLEMEEEEKSAQGILAIIKVKVKISCEYLLIQLFWIKIQQTRSGEISTSLNKSLYFLWGQFFLIIYRYIFCISNYTDYNSTLMAEYLLQNALVPLRPLDLASSTFQIQAPNIILFVEKKEIRWDENLFRCFFLPCVHLASNRRNSWYCKNIYTFCYVKQITWEQEYIYKYIILYRDLDFFFLQ